MLMSDDIMDDDNTYDLESNTPKKETEDIVSDDDFDFYG